MRTRESFVGLFIGVFVLMAVNVKQDAFVAYNWASPSSQGICTCKSRYRVYWIRVMRILETGLPMTSLFLGEA